MVAEVRIADWAGTFVEDVFVDVESEVIADVIVAITPYIAWMAALYIMGLIVLGMTGKREAFKDGAWALLKITVVSGIALNGSYIQTWLLIPIDGFLSLISNAVSGSDGLSVYGIADEAINQSLVVADQAWQKAGDAGWRDWDIKVMWIFAGFFAGGGGMVMVGPCVIAIIAAKAIIHLCFMVSPIFVIAAIFPITAKYFLNWTAGVGNSIWVIILAALIMPLSTRMTAGLMSEIKITDGLAGPLQVIAMSTFVAILFWVIIVLIFNLASTLAGGLSMTTPVTSAGVSRGMRRATTAPFRWLGSKIPFGKRGGSVNAN